MTSVYPLLLQPIYKDYVWGGAEIARRFNRQTPPRVCAESWEVSDRDDGMSIAANGPLAGRSLRQIAQAWGPDLMGAETSDARFPLLVKLIDARERLSVQVHPNCETAARFGGEAKTEMWYVLDAAPGARVYAGLKAEVDRAGFEAAVAEGTLEEVLHGLPVRAGDAVFVPGGRVHAIDAGCLIYEVQQNSNTTYRIHDWNRAGADGQPRELHIEQALRVARWGEKESARLTPIALDEAAPNERDLIVSSDYFRVERIRLRGDRALEERPDTFQIIFIAEGCAQLNWAGGGFEVPSGTTLLLPAAIRGATLVPKTPCATALRTTRG